MRQKETQKVEFEEKKNTRKLDVGTMVHAEKVKEKLNTGNNIHRVRPHLAKPASVKRTRLRDYLFLKSSNKDYHKQM